MSSVLSATVTSPLELRPAEVRSTESYGPRGVPVANGSSLFAPAEIAVTIQFALEAAGKPDNPDAVPRKIEDAAAPAWLEVGNVGETGVGGVVGLGQVVESLPLGSSGSWLITVLV